MFQLFFSFYSIESNWQSWLHLHWLIGFKINCLSWKQEVYLSGYISKNNIPTNHFVLEPVYNSLPQSGLIDKIKSPTNPSKWILSNTEQPKNLVFIFVFSLSQSDQWSITKKIGVGLVLVLPCLLLLLLTNCRFRWWCKPISFSEVTHCQRNYMQLQKFIETKHLLPSEVLAC